MRSLLTLESLTQNQHRFAKRQGTNTGSDCMDASCQKLNANSANSLKKKQRWTLSTATRPGQLQQDKTRPRLKQNYTRASWRWRRKSWLKRALPIPLADSQHKSLWGEETGHCGVRWKRKICSYFFSSPLHWSQTNRSRGGLRGGKAADMQSRGATAVTNVYLFWLGWSLQLSVWQMTHSRCVSNHKRPQIITSNAITETRLFIFTLPHGETSVTSSQGWSDRLIHLKTTIWCYPVLMYCFEGIIKSVIITTIQQKSVYKTTALKMTLNIISVCSDNAALLQRSNKQVWGCTRSQTIRQTSRHFGCII